jgi:hypothetical protein
MIGKKKLEKQILILALLAGEIMMRAGAEIYRVEDTIVRIWRVFCVQSNRLHLKASLLIGQISGDLGIGFSRAGLRGKEMSRRLISEYTKRCLDIGIPQEAKRTGGPTFLWVSERLLFAFCPKAMIETIDFTLRVFKELDWVFQLSSELFWGLLLDFNNTWTFRCG